MRYSTPFVWKRGQVSINRRLLSEYQDLGISEQLLRAWLDLVCPPGSMKRDVLVARAYDNAHRTETHLSFPEILDLPEFTIGKSD